MRVVTWNVNSVRARLEIVRAWLAANEPDVLCLQEIKVVDDAFPAAEFAELGYRATVYGQPTYNGVALLSRAEPTDVRRGFDDGAPEDPQARILRATFGDVRVIDVYVPNGDSVGSDKYAYKLAWMERFAALLRAQEDPTAPLVLVGDFNVAPEDRDVHDPDLWRGQVLFSEPEHAALAAITSFGLTDCLRLHHAEPGIYSWWDYRGLAFQKRLGLRIDLVLATAPLAARCTACRVDKDARRGKGVSDHAPVIADFT